MLYFDKVNFHLGELHVNQKFVDAVGYLGMFMAFVMFGTYVDQIILNLAGKPGSFWLPAATVLNCAAWSFYGFYKTDRDWKIVLPNALGVILGTFTAWTALYCTSGCSVS